MVEPETTDKLCRAMIAIAEALNKLDYGEAGVFLRGIRLVMPPDWDGIHDAAAPLRGSSAFGLVRIRHPEALMLLTDLLLDRDPVARTAAVQALGQSGWLAALPLLRFKARIGDQEPAVTAECLTALAGLAFDQSLPLITEFLYGANEALAEGAAFALAESRRPEALTALTDFWPRARGKRAGGDGPSRHRADPPAGRARFPAGGRRQRQAEHRTGCAGGAGDPPPQRSAAGTRRRRGRQARGCDGGGAVQGEV